MSTPEEEGYLTAIEELIRENETVKSANRKLTILCQDLLDDIVSVFSHFFPTIPAYDSDCIFKAGEEICPYYRKELFIVKTELCKSLLQILNLYGMQIDDDLENVSLDNLKEFVSVMKSGKGSLIQSMNNIQSQLEDMQHSKTGLQKQLHIKQLEIRRLCIDALETDSQLHNLRSTNQLKSLQINNLTKQLLRCTAEYQTLESEYVSVEAEVNDVKYVNQELRRQILELEKWKMETKLSHSSL